MGVFIWSRAADLASWAGNQLLWLGHWCRRRGDRNYDNHWYRKRTRK